MGKFIHRSRICSLRTRLSKNRPFLATKVFCLFIAGNRYPSLLLHALSPSISSSSFFLFLTTAADFLSFSPWSKATAIPLTLMPFRRRVLVLPCRCSHFQSSRLKRKLWKRVYEIEMWSFSTRILCKLRLNLALSLGALKAGDCEIFIGDHTDRMFLWNSFCSLYFFFSFTSSFGRSLNMILMGGREKKRRTIHGSRAPFYIILLLLFPPSFPSAFLLLGDPFTLWLSFLNFIHDLINPFCARSLWTKGMIGTENEVGSMYVASLASSNKVLDVCLPGSTFFFARPTLPFQISVSYYHFQSPFPFLYYCFVTATCIHHLKLAVLAERWEKDASLEYRCVIYKAMSVLCVLCVSPCWCNFEPLW